MELVENSVWNLTINGKNYANELTKLESSVQSLKDKQAELTKGTKEWTENKQQIAALEAEMKKVRAEMGASGMTVLQLKAYHKELNKELSNLVPGTEAYLNKTKELKDVNTRLANVRADTRAVADEANNTGGVWSKMKGWIVAAFAIEALVAFAGKLADVGMKVFEITAKFETYGTILKTTLGGQKEAAAAMEMIKDIAAETPISVDEMTSAFIKMVNRGLQPTQKEIKNLADLAASQGKSFDQLTEAVLDAMNGEGERLKEFGIKMKKSGDDVSLSFKGQTVSVKNNEKSIYDAITAMGEYNGVAGMTTEISQTLTGKTSNLGDSLDNVMVTLGEKLRPAFVFILDLFAKGVDWLGKLVNGSTPLNAAFDLMWSVITDVWNAGKGLFLTLFPNARGTTITFSGAVQVLATVLGLVAGVIKTVFGVVEILIDGFVVASKASKAFGLAMIGDFAGAAKAAGETGKSWDSLKTNASKNFGDIGTAFKKMWSDNAGGVKQAANDVDVYGKVAKKTEEDITVKQDTELGTRKAKHAEAIDEMTQKTLNAMLDTALASDNETSKRLSNIEKIKNKEAELVSDTDRINQDLRDKLRGYNSDKETSWLNTNQKILTDTEQKVSAIGALMAGDLSGFTKAMGDKLSSVQSFKINALNSYMQLYEQVSGMINDQVAKFADAARAMIEIAQTRLQVQFAILDQEKAKATETKREELRDLGQQVDAYDLKIAQLVVQQYATSDKKRQEDLQLEIDKLEKEKKAIVAQKDLTSLEIKQIETNHDNATRSRKLEMWKKQQDLEIKLAKINAIQAYVKALSSGFPPMNWMNAATVMYAAKEQMNLIRAETPPEFSKGGYVRNAGVPKGPRHGSIYGQGGIALMNRETGQEVGEIEGGEPIMILSRNLYANNGPLIDRLMESSLYRNGAPVYQKGGVVGSDGGSYQDYLEPVRYGQMYLFGSRKRKKAQREAESALAEAQALSASMSAENFDASHQMAGMMMENQAVSAENAGLTVEVLNEISEGLGVHLPAIRESIEGGNARMEMMLARMSDQIGVLYGIKGATDRVADNVNMSKRNDL